jgi:hypothetical protein
VLGPGGDGRRCLAIALFCSALTWRGPTRARGQHLGGWTASVLGGRLAAGPGVPNGERSGSMCPSSHRIMEKWVQVRQYGTSEDQSFGRTVYFTPLSFPPFSSSRIIPAGRHTSQRRLHYDGTWFSAFRLYTVRVRREELRRGSQSLRHPLGYRFDCTSRPPRPSFVRAASPG